MSNKRTLLGYIDGNTLCNGDFLIKLERLLNQNGLDACNITEYGLIEMDIRTSLTDVEVADKINKLMSKSPEFQNCLYKLYRCSEDVRRENGR